jgi:hypothetical protein
MPHAPILISPTAQEIKVAATVEMVEMEVVEVVVRGCSAALLIKATGVLALGGAAILQLRTHRLWMESISVRII